jgi:hypothetical protein
MSETGWRLTIGSVLSVILFGVLTAATDWPAVVVFIVAIVCGFLLSVVDVIFIFLFEAVAEAFDQIIS